MSEATDVVQVTITTFDGHSGEHLSTETVTVPTGSVLVDPVQALTARIETAAQEGLITDEQRDALLG